MSYIQVFCYSIISLPFYGMLNGQPQTLKRCGCPFIIELAYICRHPPFGTGQGFAGGKHFYIVLRDYLNRKLLITVLADPDKLPIRGMAGSFCPAGWTSIFRVAVMHYIPCTFHCLHLSPLKVVSQIKEQECCAKVKPDISPCLFPVRAGAVAFVHFHAAAQE